MVVQLINGCNIYICRYIDDGVKLTVTVQLLMYFFYKVGKCSSSAIYTSTADHTLKKPCIWETLNLSTCVGNITIFFL